MIEVIITADQEAIVLRNQGGDAGNAQLAVQTVMDNYIGDLAAKQVWEDTQTLVKGVKIPLTDQQKIDIAVILAPNK